MAADQQRFEVFVSSTYSDLREARQRVTMTLLECDAFPTGMEIFPATDDDAWTLIRRIIDGCDAPLLLQECEETALQKKIEHYLLFEYYTDNTGAVVSTVKEKHSIAITRNDCKNWKVGIDVDDFGTILVQLTALGLICRSERKRSVTNKGTYWALTPYGETRTVQLRAIKKAAASAHESSVDD